MITKSAEMEARATDEIVELMALAARTAPKGRGVDNLVVIAVRAKVKDQLSAEMRRILKEDDGLPHFERDAGNIDKATVVLLLGQKVKPMGPRPCGFCGYKDCEENVRNNGLCAISIGDLGIALGSAVSVAAAHHVDNRIMFSAGKAALNLNLFDDPQVRIAYGIPLSVTGKSPFFDRG
ncbi:MAG: hypothetical protein H6Q76_1488 [Firmicutes bacterium]|nr:hypothetical protein [Bacillota bacterium]